MTIHLPEMRRADGAIFLTCAENDRLAIATSIERLIDLLDAMQPDPDLEGDWADWEPEETECSLGWSEGETLHGNLTAGSHDLEPSLGWTACEAKGRYQASWITDGEEDAGDDREDVSEDEGADIQSQPHDATDEGDYEPFLGWTEKCSQRGVGLKDWNGMDASDNGGTLVFNGDGVLAGKTVLRELKRRRPDVPQEYVRTMPANGNPAALVVDGLNINAPAHGKATRITQATVDTDWWIEDAIQQIDPAKWREAHYRAAHEKRQ
jgi:hypothetical protein